MEHNPKWATDVNYIDLIVPEKEYFFGARRAMRPPLPEAHGEQIPQCPPSAWISAWFHTYLEIDNFKNTNTATT